MIYLKKVKVISDIQPLKSGLVIEFKKPICFLVGDNGIGKSTVLDCLAEEFGYKDDTYFKRTGVKKHIVAEKENDFKTKYIDFHAHDRKYSGSFGDDMSLQLMQMKASSGQVSISLFNKMAKFENGLLLLDEPERGLSIKNQWKIVNLISGFEKQKNCQFVVTSHSDIILKYFRKDAQYFSISENKDVTYEEFMISQLM